MIDSPIWWAILQFFVATAYMLWYVRPRPSLPQKWDKAGCLFAAGGMFRVVVFFWKLSAMVAVMPHD